MSDLNECILEIRYKPNSKVLDHRGAWAEEISNHMRLSEWRITENRVDIHNKERTHRVSVGFKNAGFVVCSVPTRNYFPEKASKLLRLLFGLDGFGNAIYVERLGIRMKSCKEFDGKFEELREKYISRYISPTQEATALFDAELVDIGAPLDFKDNLGNFNTMSGPMKQDEMSKFFERDEDFPEIGLFFDIDYWITPKEFLKGAEVIGHVKKFAVSAWNRIEVLSGLILKD